MVDVVDAAKSSKVGMLNRHWTAFFTGPYFKTIPSITLEERKKLGRAKAKDIVKGKVEREEGVVDYIAALKKIILDDIDTDGKYGLVNDELVPLPFDCPKIFEYFIDFLAGAYLVAQATVVMFIAILVDNDERGYQLGNSYTSKWLPLVKALVIAYPLLTLLSLTMVTTEYLFRRFMYYRMLSMRVLVDWENKKLWQGMFFYWFLFTWILMNTWCLYGVIRFWNEGLRTGADTVQFTTWIVVNLQTMQLLLYYMRMITSELRLVSLNQIFERAPVEAQMLLTYTYIIEESVLIDECNAFGHVAVSALLRRLANLLTCGRFCREWRAVSDRLKFDLDRVKAKADNYEAVEEATLRLRNDLLAELADEEREGRTSAGDARSPKGSRGGAVRSGGGAGSAGSAAATKVTSNPLAASLMENAQDPAPDAPTVDVMVVPTDRASRGGAAEAAAAEPVAPEHHELAEQVLASHFTEGAQLGLIDRMQRAVARWLYYRFYGTIHGFYVSFLVSMPSWPYRGDVPYFRTLCVVQLFGVLSVGAIVVFGILRATDTSRCSQGNKRCEGCAEFKSLYQGICPMEYNITYLPQSPPPQLG